MPESQNFSSHTSITMFLAICSLSTLLFNYCECFIIPTNTIQRSSLVLPKTRQNNNSQGSRSAKVSALNVWWFGGNDNESENADESCELVPVRIEKTSANSRKIAGEIIVPAPLTDVWAILTDYNHLATHVPNLVQSRVLSSSSPGEQGDGEYTCRLYQQGAQKIVGFQFGADVTMDMKENIIVGPPSSSAKPETPSYPEQKQISFKCVDSFFFKEFDGIWQASEVNEDGEILTKLKYVVDVRPKGPVPVAALEWRIREDVPTNLRAVKKAALTVGEAGVMATRQSRETLKQSVRRVLVRQGEEEDSWQESETMAAYLK